MFKFIRGQKSGLRRSFVVLPAILLSAVILFTVNNPRIVGASATTRLVPIYSVQRDNRAVSLTFDISSADSDYGDIIDALAKYNIPATFFVTGTWAQAHPDTVKALQDAGHEIMSGGDEIVRFASLSHEQLAENITEANSRISAVTGSTPSLIRIPYGEYDDNVINTINALNMSAVQWSLDSGDSKAGSPDEIVERICTSVAPGDIIRFRTGTDFTAQALPQIIEYLISNRYSVVPVSHLILQGDCTVSYDGRQRPAQLK